MNFKQSLMSGKLADRINEVVTGETINSSEIAYNILKPLMSQHAEIEGFYSIFLNAKNKIIKIEKVFSGTLTACAVYPRELIKKALEYNAAAMILAHNHPSGDIDPSKADIDITKRIMVGCDIMGLMIHDHLIIGNKCIYSMAESGTIADIKNQIEAMY